MIDYKELGFKCGIEIHQQLEGKKLFCNCPTTIRKDKPDFTFKRRLRASAGESGKIDIAAALEQKKSKLFTYWGYEDTTCLVEMDEEPPGKLNKEALRTALLVAKMLNCKIVDKVQFMRKTVVDGSNTSGFQRTALIGMDGHIDVDGKKIGIEGLFLEEEACQIMERTDKHDTYNISRLGIPLLEIATAPDISTAEECQKAAGKIGMILRSVDTCKRGIGSIRQDVNLSIKNGARTEIKGFQDLRSIPKVIEFEINRQLKVINSGKKVEKEVRKAEPDFTTSFLRPMPGASRMYPETDVAIVDVDLKSIKEVETIEDMIGRFKRDYDLNEDYATQAVKFQNKEGTDLEKIFKTYPNIEPKLIVDTFITNPKQINKAHGLDFIPNVESMDEMFDKINAGGVEPSAVLDIETDIAKGKKVDYAKYKKMSSEDIKAEVEKIVKENPGAPMGALMGKAMAKLQGKADGKIVSEIIKKLS